MLWNGGMLGGVMKQELSVGSTLSTTTPAAKKKCCCFLTFLATGSMGSREDGTRP